MDDDNRSYFRNNLYGTNTFSLILEKFPYGATIFLFDIK